MEKIQEIWDIISSQNANIYWMILTVMLFFLYLIHLIKMEKVLKKYNKVVRKLGNGSNLDEMMQKYIEKAEKVEGQYNDLLLYCNKLEKSVQKCTQKVGVVRYNAFNDMGSDLSFAVALLDYENNGVIINGVFSRDGSNTYAKPIIKGESKYNLSGEEQKAIEIAKNSISEYVLNIK